MPDVLRSFVSFVLSASAALASEESGASLCIAAAESAARETGVPVRLLNAITRVETQRDGAPWPWSLNVQGTGHWFSSRAEALEAAQNALSQTSSIDIGCFQINTLWHAENFPSLDTMMDPETNALYAANYLLNLHRQKGNWTDAVAAYHAGDADMGRAYVERVGAMLAADTNGRAEETAHRPNGFPLMVAGAAGAPGSLVPLQTGRPPLFGGP